MMVFIWVLITAILWIQSAKTDNKCHPPSQQGLSYTFTYTVETVNIDQYHGLQWLINVPGISVFFALWRCFVGMLECEPLSDFDWIQTNANITQYGNEYQNSYFTIHNVSTKLDGSTVQWGIYSGSFASCQLEVYDFNSNPACEEPYLENKGSARSPDIHLIINCSIINAYPEPVCELKTTEHGHLMSTVLPEYFDGGSCAFTIPVTDLEPKQYYFQVFMYPNISNGQDYGKIAVSTTNDLLLPEASCAIPRLSANNNDVIVTCAIQSPFTDFSCIFYEQTEEIGTYRTVGHPSHSTFSSCSTDQTVTCDYQCSLTLPVSQLGVGLHKFLVSVSKDGYSINSYPTGDYQLWYPQPKIVNCVNGENDYIKEGTLGTCECELIEPGNPPGRAQWVISENRREVGNIIDDTRSLLSVAYDPKDLNQQIYHCQGATPLPHESIPKESFSPKFAYGPESIADFNLPEVYNLCPPLNPLHISCNVDKSTVNPQPEVVIEVPGMNDLAPLSIIESAGQYSFQFFFTPQTGNEKLVVVCRANNSEFPVLSASSYKEITVREPPKNAPVISINEQTTITKGQIVNVSKGQSMQVFCDVKGGVPPVTKVTLRCGQHVNVSQGPHTSLGISIDKTNNNEVCVCTAEHPTGCYDKSSDFTFNVYFGPDNIKAMINTDVIKLCHEKEESFSLYCDVPINDANPKPTVLLEGTEDVNVLQPVNETLVSGNYRSHFVVFPSHGGIFTAFCVAHNPFIPAFKAEDDTFVVVLEPPSSPPSMSVDNLSSIQEGQTVNVTNGQQVQVQCDVTGGFPPVIKSFMKCAGLEFEESDTRHTRNISIMKTNNSDLKTCSCSALHPSDCYGLSTTFTFNIQYQSTVTNYTVQIPTLHGVDQNGTKEDSSASGQVEVDAGTLVTFVCEGEGNPRPDMKVNSQSSITPIPSQLTPAGSFKNKAVASKTMTCKDTAFYVCEAFNGIGVASNGTILVLVKCSPEISEEYNAPGIFYFIDGADVEVKFQILGYPDPFEFSLTKTTTRRKRSIGKEDVLEQAKYNVTFKRLNEMYGEVTLILYAMTHNDKGQYKLQVQNGIGDGLEFTFNAAMQEGGDNSGNIGALIGGTMAGLVVAAVIVFIIIFLCRKGKQNEHQTSCKNHRPEVSMSDYEDFDCPAPKRNQYEEIDTEFDAGCSVPGDSQKGQAKTRYENVDIHGRNVSKNQRQQQHASCKNRASEIPMSTYESVGCPAPSRNHYEEIDIEVDSSCTISADFQKGKAKAGYENVDIKEQCVSKEGVPYESAYEDMGQNALTKVKKKTDATAYVNVTVTSQDLGKKCDMKV